MELAASDMTTPDVLALCAVRDRIEIAREYIEQVRALTRGPVSASVTAAVYWKVRELL